MRLFAELRRRKVLQTAAIYAASAWLLLQVAEFLLQMLEVPAWGLKLVFVVLLVGFPLALVLSWMHQITPQGIRRESDLGVSDPEPDGPRAELPVPAARIASPCTDADSSIAVLPFANMSDDPANAHFADGLSEELLNLLSRIQGLRVVARTSSFSFRGRAVDAATIARELNVAHLLEGSVRRAGSRVRITAQLVRAADSSHTWSQTFDRDLGDIFAIQDEIASAVVRELEVKLMGKAAPKAWTTDTDAYAHYLRGRHFNELASKAGYEQAIVELEAALAIDPRFAPAWATLGSVYWSGANNSLIDYAEGARRARQYSEKALLLDPNLAEPMSLRGYFEVIEGIDLEGGLRRMERARELEPHNPRILTRLANIATRRGRLEDALRYCNEALRADPLSPLVHAVFGNTCFFAGRLDEAETMRRRVLELSPGWLSGHFYLGRILLEKNEKEEALAEMRREQSAFWQLTGLAIAHHALGQAEAADEALSELMRMPAEGAAYQRAQVFAYRGDVDAAFQWLDRAAATHDAGLGFAGFDPLLARLRGDARWQPFLERNGLAPCD
jgi:TolB-like protein/Flp pilus assembly protein TadD